MDNNTNTTPNTEAIVMDAAACMPNSCWGRYSRVAVVEVDRAVLDAEEIDMPRMISKRARGVVRIVQTWERLNVGTTDRCAYRVALAEAEALADEINA